MKYRYIHSWVEFCGHWFEHMINALKKPLDPTKDRTCNRIYY